MNVVFGSDELGDSADQVAVDAELARFDHRAVTVDRQPHESTPIIERCNRSAAVSMAALDDEHALGRVEALDRTADEREMSEVDGIERAAQHDELGGDHASPRCASHFGNSSRSTVRSTSGARDRNSSAIAVLQVTCP